jgi:hypothetical protein
MATTEVEALAVMEPLQLLWDGMRKALVDSGMDTADVAAVSAAIVHLADHRLLWLDKLGGSAEVAAQVRHYREMAARLHRQAITRPEGQDFERLAQARAATGQEDLGGERVAGKS